MSELEFYKNSRWKPFTKKELKLAKQLEKKYNIRLLFNDHKLTWYCRKYVKITTSSGELTIGRVIGYVHPEDSPTNEQGVIVETPDGTKLEIYESTIRDIEECPKSSDR